MSHLAPDVLPDSPTLLPRALSSARGTAILLIPKKQGHLPYATFRRRGVPCGSAAIESTIRRVINLRLKNNATYWLEENAEGVFAIRGLLLCDRWDETLSRVRQTMAVDRRIAWQWDAPDLTKLNADEPVLPPSPQTPEKPIFAGLAS